MQAHEIQPGDTVEIVLTVKVSKVTRYDGPMENGTPPFTAIEFDEFPLSPPNRLGMTTSAFTLELADTTDAVINRA